MASALSLFPAPPAWLPRLVVGGGGEVSHHAGGKSGRGDGGGAGGDGGSGAWHLTKPIDLRATRKRREGGAEES